MAEVKKIEAAVNVAIEVLDDPTALANFWKRHQANGGNEPDAAATELIKAVTGEHVIDTVPLRRAILGQNPDILSQVKQAAGWEPPTPAAAAAADTSKIPPVTGAAAAGGATTGTAGTLAGSSLPPATAPAAATPAAPEEKKK